jgi:hypothetical protein
MVRVLLRDQTITRKEAAELLDQSDGYALKLIGKLGKEKNIYETPNAKAAVCLTGVDENVGGLCFGVESAQQPGDFSV